MSIDSTASSVVDEKRLQEAKDVAKLIKEMDKQVTPGSKWFIVSMRWIDKWQKYTYFDMLD